MTGNKPSKGVMCHYCHNSRHVSQNCRKLQSKYQIFQFVYYQKSLKSTSISTTTLVESGKMNTCLISSSSIWVIDSRAIDHMIGNFSLFTTFQSYPYSSTVTLVDGSTSCVLGSETIRATPQITLSFVLSLPYLSFNLIYLGKITCTLNYSISFYPIIVLFRIFRQSELLVEDASLGVSTSLTMKCQSLLLVLELLPHSNYIVT